MAKENMYDSTILNTITSKITSLVNDHLIPQLDFLLNSEQEQEESVASMTLNLVAVLLFQINNIFIIKRYCETCQVFFIFKYYNVRLSKGYPTRGSLRLLEIIIVAKHSSNNWTDTQALHLF